MSRQDADAGVDTALDGASRTLYGRRITLRPVKTEDRSLLEDILDEPEVARWWRRDEWDRVLAGATETYAVVLTNEAGDAGAGQTDGARRTGAEQQTGAERQTGADQRTDGVRRANDHSSVIGMIQYEEETDPDYHQAGIDLFISTRLHGRGYGPEAIRLLVHHLIDVRGHHRFMLDPAVENERAVRAYGKVGFKPVGVMRKYERIADGSYRDALLMELLAEEVLDG